MASCDRQAAVYLAQDAAYRVVDGACKDGVLKVLKIVSQLKEESLVDTEICPEERIPDGIRGTADSLVLKHRKIRFISYPHEWCAAMLKDAALYQTALSTQLMEHGLFLKDAHPWNILFENGHPVFVDFTSIVTQDLLFAEEYLDANRRCAGEPDEIRLSQVLKEIAERMYLPYFFNPLCAYAFGNRSVVAKEIENTTLNTIRSSFSIRTCLPALRPSISAITMRIGLMRAQYGIRKSLSRLSKENRPPEFFREASQNTQKLAVETRGSAYSKYYQLKGEDQSWIFSPQWNDKQKTVYRVLNSPDIATVLDVACNTGWYSVLAEKLGKHVVAFDIDEACIEALYSQVKAERLDILPLVMNITALTGNRKSIHDGQDILIEATERLRCDSVMALGIFHHLILGAGLTFDQALDYLVPLCNKQMIIEFVDASDLMIQNEPEFFSAYFKDAELLTDYNVDRLAALCEARGFRVKQERSYPATRSILVCEKRPTA